MAEQDDLPPIDKRNILPYSAIRYVAGYPESYVREYALEAIAADRARAAISTQAQPAAGDAKTLADERESFEAKLTEQRGLPHMQPDWNRRYPTGEYMVSEAQSLWLGWQLARAPHPTPVVSTPAQPAAGEAVPVAWRTRYRSEPGMIGHYPWAYVEKKPTRIGETYEHEPLYATPRPAQVAEPVRQAAENLGSVSEEAKRMRDRLAALGVSEELAERITNEARSFFRDNMPTQSNIVLFTASLCRAPQQAQGSESGEAGELSMSMFASREDFERASWGLWRDIVLKPDGTLDAEQVRKELADYSMILDNFGKVLEHVTGGRISKPNTLPSAICQVADEHYSELAADDAEDERDPAANDQRDAARQPLTDEQVMALLVELNAPCVTASGPSEMFATIVRAVERAHAIESDRTAQAPGGAE